MYRHSFGFVSQDLAEQAKKNLSSLDYIQGAQVLDLPVAWTLEFCTEGQLDQSKQNSLVSQANPMIPIFNKVMDEQQWGNDNDITLEELQEQYKKHYGPYKQVGCYILGQELHYIDGSGVEKRAPILWMFNKQGQDVLLVRNDNDELDEVLSTESND